MQRVEQTEEVRLVDATFLVRVTIDERLPAFRYLIRHLGSGRETYLQGGADIDAFVRSLISKQADESGG